MTNEEWAELDNVNGWLSRVEADTLEELARDRYVLEIGSYCGKSTIAMAKTARLVVSLDHHRGDSGTGDADTFAEFRSNIKRFGLEKKIVPVVMDIADAWPILRILDIFEFVFIDGEHTYNSVCRDLSIAIALHPRVIALHDAQYQDVSRAADEFGLCPFDEVVGTLGITRSWHRER